VFGGCILDVHQGVFRSVVAGNQDCSLSAQRLLLEPGLHLCMLMTVIAHLFTTQRSLHW